MDELKPCPFCGGTKFEWQPCGDEGDIYTLSCKTDGCILSETSLDLWLSKTRIAELWNTRQSPSYRELVVELVAAYKASDIKRVDQVVVKARELLKNEAD